MTGELLKKENFDNATYFSSFEGKYIIFDNLDTKAEPLIKARDVFQNSLYVYVIVVVQGTLNIRVNSTDLQIHSNEYLTIMPCTTYQLQDSRCLYFVYATQSYIINSIYKIMDIKRDLYTHCFTFHHHRFPLEQVTRMKQTYQRVKREHERKDFFMKEFTIRSMLITYYAQLYSILPDAPEITYTQDSRQANIFKRFIEILDKNYTKERSVNFYAEQVKITPKYLSATTSAIAGVSASKIIDDYVVFQIKQELYTNTKSIKEISEELNFQSQSFFGRYFKRVTGLSPREYINQFSVKLIEAAK